MDNLILNDRRVDVQYRWVIESFAPGIIDRQSLFEPLQTGVLSIDSMEHLARGKPDLISSFYDFREFQEFPFFSFFTFFSVFTIFTFPDFHGFSFSRFSRFLIFMIFMILAFSCFHDFDLFGISFSRF